MAIKNSQAIPTGSINPKFEFPHKQKCGFKQWIKVKNEIFKC